MITRETILEALRVTLSSLCSGRVYRSRKEQLPHVPAIVIRPVREEDEGAMLGCRDVLLHVAIEIYARGEIPEQASDPVLSAVLAALDAAPTLGLGSDVQILPRRETEFAVENYDDSGLTLLLQITYRTQ